MISYDYINISNNYYRVAILDATGDSIKIITNYPALGIKSIEGFEITAFGDIEISFRYSKDSVFWSEWDILTLSNLQNIDDLKENHPFQIEYHIINKSGISWIKSIMLKINYVEILDPVSYDKLPTSNFFPFKNKQSLQWSANILTKTFKKGILAKFIKRKFNFSWDDEDFLDYWWTIIYLDALRVTYNGIFKEILFRPDLLSDYLQQRNLIVRKRLDLSELYYLATHYYNEIRRRGTSLIVEDEYTLPKNFYNVKVQGELFRFLNIESKRNIEFNVVSGSDLGWFVGNSSPGFNDTIHTTQFIKGFEYTKEVRNLNLYPLNQKENISLIYDHSIGLNVMNLIRNQTGIKYDDDKDKLIWINPNFSYEISFLIKAERGAKISFGVNAFDRRGIDIGRFISIGNLNFETNVFVDDLQLSSDRYTLVRALLYSINTEVKSYSESLLNIGYGTSLRFKNESTRAICPFLLLEDSNNTNKTIKIVDFKIRPANISLADFLSQENLVLLRIDKETIDRDIDTIDKFLTPYNSELQLEYKENE